MHIINNEGGGTSTDEGSNLISVTTPRLGGLGGGAQSVVCMEGGASFGVVNFVNLVSSPRPVCFLVEELTG